jgi:uncharacterized protein (TIGR01244 family)
MRKTVLLSILLAAAVSVSAGDGVPETVDPAQIPNYKKVTPTLAAAGQPTAEVLPKLGALGFKTVINLRMPNEDQPANERALVEAQGLRYVSVPVTSSILSQADVDAVAKVLDDPASGPVLMHCARAARVGAIWSLIQLRNGKTLDEALAAGREAGNQSPALEEAVRRLAAPAPKAP